MTGAGRHRPFYGYILVFSGFLIMLSMYGTLYSFGVFLKPLLDELGRSRASVSGAYSLCFFLSGALAMAAGWLNDRIGPRMVISCGGILIGSGYILLSQTRSLPGLYLYLGLLVGVGMSSGITPVFSTIAKWFEKRRGLMTGAAIAGIGTGTWIVPPVANALISTFGWRISCFILGLTAFVMVLGLAQFFIGDPARKGLLPYGSEHADGHVSSLNVEGISLGHACRTSQLWILFAIYVCSGFFIQIALIHIPIYALSAGISPAQAAMLLSTMGIGSLIGRIAGGAASDMFGNRPVMITSLILMACQFSLLLFSSSAWALFLFAGLFGLVYGEILCMMPLLPAELFGLKNHGAILGIITCASTIGGSLGPVIAGAVFDTYGGYKIVWLICIGLSVAASFLSVSLKKTGVKGGLTQACDEKPGPLNERGHE